MAVISFQFLLFAAVTAGVYFLVPKRAQWAVLLAANIVFYSFAGARYLLYMVWSALAAFLAAGELERLGQLGRALADAVSDPAAKREAREAVQRIRKLLCALAAAFSMGIWVLLKYGNFVAGNVNAVLRALGCGWQAPRIPFVLPLGMSFYVFHAVGYLIDVYRGKYAAERSFFRFFTFVSFFPHIVEGPFSRYDALGADILRPHAFSWDRLCAGCARILWGVFKKTVVADKIGVSVAAVFGDFQAYTGAHILFAMLAYGIQIYADFSGYMDIMCGLCRVLGIELAENFRQPYFAESVEEFWRRWHMTLGRWFRDYVFYPVSMSAAAQRLGRRARKRWGAKLGKLAPGYLALLFVWTATGLWHGARWTYLVWGYLNLLVILTSMQLSDRYARMRRRLHMDGPAGRVFRMARTFALVCFFRFFSRAGSLGAAFSMLRQIAVRPELRRLAAPWRLFVGTGGTDVRAIFAGAALLLAVDILCECGKWEAVKARCPMPLRNLAYAGLIFAVMLFAGGDNDLVKGFLYANF